MKQMATKYGCNLSIGEKRVGDAEVNLIYFVMAA
jgi:hypothetical protein